MIITSLQNPLVKDVIKLRKQRERRKDDLIIIEGEKEVSMAVVGGVKIKTFFYCRDFGLNENTLTELNHGKVINVSREVFCKISKRENPDGILVVAKTSRNLLSDISIQKDSLFIALEAVEKPGNVGAVIRTAEAVGAEAVILIDSVVDFYNPNTIRTSRGSVFNIKSVSCSRGEFFLWARANRITTIAASLEANRYYTDIDFKRAVAVLIGTEHEGLSEDTLRETDVKIKIPMSGKIDSLNASVSAAVIMYEALRQKMKK